MLSRRKTTTGSGRTTRWQARTFVARTARYQQKFGPEVSELGGDCALLVVHDPQKPSQPLFQSRQCLLPVTQAARSVPATARDQQLGSSPAIQRSGRLVALYR